MRGVVVGSGSPHCHLRVVVNNVLYAACNEKTAKASKVRWLRRYAEGNVGLPLFAVLHLCPYMIVEEKIQLNPFLTGVDS